MIEEFNTSMGRIFIIENEFSIRVGDEVEINNETHKVKRVISPTKPTEKNVISIIV
jgi:hypothetical protein